MSGGVARRRARGALAAALLASLLSACGETRELTIGPVEVPGTRAFEDLDVFVIASNENNLLFADVYGITLRPLTAHRITADKRVSSLDANARRVVVAAADEQVDKLGIVTEAGEVKPIPGLGRPFAYTPVLLANGLMLYGDFVEDDNQDRTYRHLTWDPRSEKKTVLFRSRDTLLAPTAGPGGRLAFLQPEDSGADRIVVRDGERSRRIRLPGDSGYLHWGAKLIATSLDRPTDGFDVQPTGTLLIDPDSGKIREIPGWDPIAWSPNGRMLLVRDSSDLTNTTLALLDPKDAENPRVLGTLPNLTLYTGSWVRGSA